MTIFLTSRARNQEPACVRDEACERRFAVLADNDSYRWALAADDDEGIEQIIADVFCGARFRDTGTTESYGHRLGRPRVGVTCAR